MHEISLCESMIELAEERAISDGYKRVRKIHLQIGRLSCVEPAAMLFAFDAVAKGSVAEDAELLIDHEAGSAWCHSCQMLVEISERYDACPECNAVPLEIRSGEAMRIIEMEVE